MMNVKRESIKNPAIYTHEIVTLKYFQPPTLPPWVSEFFGVGHLITNKNPRLARAGDENVARDRWPV